MGTSKVILASGMFVIIGMYSLAFRTADNASFTVAQAQAFRNQATQIALAGVRFASVDLGNRESPGVLPSGTVNLMGGSTTYVTDRPAGYPVTQVRVTSTGNYGGHSITTVAVMNWSSLRWTITRTYAQSSAAGYSKLN
jgi:hypothetical protein